METADVVIIGGGAIGTSLAYHLRRTGTERVLLLERNGLGSGATGQAAGLIRHQYSNELLVRLAVEGRRRLERFGDEVGEDIGLVKNGLLLLMGQENVGAVTSSLELQRAAGVAASLLSAEDLDAVLPQLRLSREDIGVAIFDHDAAYCDPYKVAAGYGRRAAELGAEVRIGRRVVGLSVAGSRVVSVRTDTGDVTPGLVVNAAGPWAAWLNEQAGVELPLSLMSLQHGVLLPVEPYEPSTPTLIDNTVPDHLFFVKPESGASILLGMDREDPGKQLQPDSYAFDPPFSVLSGLAKTVCARAPSLRRSRLQSVFGALDSVTPDWNPMLGYAPGLDNFLCGIGFSGHGLKLAPCIGEILADLSRGNRPRWDISPLDIGRFDSGQALDAFHSVLA